MSAAEQRVRRGCAHDRVAVVPLTVGGVFEVVREGVAADVQARALGGGEDCCGGEPMSV